MFADPKPERSRFHSAPFAGSLLAHAAVLAWLLHGPQPVVLKLVTVRAGTAHASSLPLYMPNLGEGKPAGAEANEKRAMSQTALLNWRPAHETAHHRHGLAASADDADSRATKPGAPPVSGSPNASSSYGVMAGADIRPALPVHSSEPHVSHDDLANLNEGDVIVEITIDEKGRIVEKKVMTSLAPDIDQKVLAALEDWSFTPATRNGIPIASKQDVYYHFRPN